MKEKISIAIRGLAGSGKGAVAKEVAKRLNAEHIDCGAIFRAVMHYCMTYHKKVSQCRVSLREGIVVVNGMGYPEEFLRSETIGKATSDFCKDKTNELRLISLCNNLISSFPRVVFDGRNAGLDIGKERNAAFFLETSARIRAKRRAKQLGGIESEADILNLLLKRDAVDRSRNPKLCMPSVREIIIRTDIHSIKEVSDKLINSLTK